MKPIVFIIACLLWSSLAFSEPLVIHAGAVVDTEKGKVHKNVTIFIDGKKILKMEKGFQSPPDTKVIDLKDATVMPGLMDMHTHLSMEFNNKTYSERYTLNEADYAVRAVTFAQKTLLSGFTTVRDLGDVHHISIALKKAISSRTILGPRIFTAGKSIATTGGHADPTNGRRFDELDFPGPEAGVVNGATQARAAVRQRYKEGSDLIKITATGGVLSTAKSGQNPQFMMDELQAIIKTAKDYGFTVAAHAHGKQGMLRAIKAGVTSIEHGTYLDTEVLRAMKKMGTYYVPTIMAGNWVAEKAKIDGFFPDIVRPKAAAIGPQIQATFKKAVRYGVKIAFGTDSGVSAHGDNAQEFELMVAGGMSPLRAIQSATIEAAKLLRQEDSLGSIAPGKWADIVAVKGNPLKNIGLMNTIFFVMKDGVIYKENALRVL